MLKKHVKEECMELGFSRQNVPCQSRWMLVLIRLPLGWNESTNLICLKYCRI